MPNSLEFSVEDFFIRLYQADPRSAGKTVCHFDEATEAEPKSIVIQAVEGNQILAAFGGSEVEVIVEYRAPLKTSRAENDQAAAMLRGVVYNSVLSVPDRVAMKVAAGISDLLIKDEVTGDRENTNDLRKRSITLPVQAKLS